MFTVFTVTLIPTLICLIDTNGPQLYSSPVISVPNPCHVIRQRVSDSLLLTHGYYVYDNVIYKPYQAAADFYGNTFGDDTIYGWTDIECYTHELYEYSWPFRSVKCVWFATPKDYAIAIELTLVFCITAVLVVLWYLDLLYEPVLGNSWGSWYINLLKRCVKQPFRDCANVRSTFLNTMKVGNPSLVKNHSHPKSARCRTMASRQCEVICANLGTTPYFFQQSRSDQRKKLDGCRTYFWGKDAVCAYSPWNPPVDSTYCMIDVDYYLDMPYLLASYPNHYMISSLQPSSVAYSGDEYQFTFNENNSIHYTVSGGATYDHQIWNYRPDIVVATTRSWTKLWWYITAYNVDRRQLDPHHQLINLTPMYHVISPFWSLSSYVGGNALERLKVAVGEFARLDVLTPTGLIRSTAKLGSYAVASIPVEVDDSLSSVARMTNVPLTMAQVRTTTGVVDAASASALAEYHRTTTGVVPDLVCPAQHSVNRYQYYPDEFDVTAKNKLIPFMSPFIPGCYSPDSCANNDKAAVQGRVVDVKAPEDLEVTPFIQSCIDEFLSYLIPDKVKHTHYPVDLDYVYEKQNRPAQRALLHRAEIEVGNPSPAPVSTFQKAEAYQKAGEPRIISTIPEVDKLHYSSFTYAFNACLKATEWYAFGKTPLEIAMRVVTICVAAAACVLKTDFSRMDGRVSIILRMLERTAMLRYFHVTCHHRLVELMETQQNKRAVTSFGVKYKSGFARLSGSPETADFNSMDDAFIAYMGYRKMGKSPEDSYKMLGIFGGDDGLTADLDPKCHIKASESVGQLLEVEEVRRGEGGVQFLAREYSPDVWHGEPSSMCDIKRQLSKLHTTVHLPSKITPLHKFAVKLFSYSLTDLNTPVIGDLAALVVRRFPEFIISSEENLDIRKKVANYFSHMPKDVQFPNDNHGGWMDDVLLREIPTFNMLRFKEWIKQVEKGVADVLTPPLFADVLFTEHEPQKTDVVINGDIVKAKQYLDDSKVEKLDIIPPIQFKSKTMCKFAKAGTCNWGAKCRFAHAVV